MNSTSAIKVDSKRSLRSALFIGIGIMAAVDEIIFHQLLSWHHFYDRSTPEVGLMADGLLHSAELIFTVAGFFMFADVRRNQALVPQRAWAGFFLGAGGFHLFDGIISHKALRLHQIRYNVDILPYDVAWNIVAVILLLIGFILYRRSGRME